MTFLGGADRTADCGELLRTGRRAGPDRGRLTEAPTRVILTVLTESTTDQTAFFDPDPAISPAEAEALIERVEQALSRGEVSALTLSGSSPSPATHGIYSDLISLAKARRIPVFLDTYGPALEGIWGFWPSVIQLNRKEAAGQLRKATATDQDVLGLLENWHRHGVTCGIVTDGPNPAIIQARQKRFRATPPPIKAVNPIGSGDSLLAGLVDAWLAGSDTEPMIRHAMGCAAANAAVWDAGAVDPEQAKRFAEEVILEPIGQGGEEREPCMPSHCWERVPRSAGESRRFRAASHDLIRLRPPSPRSIPRVSMLTPARLSTARLFARPAPLSDADQLPELLDERLDVVGLGFVLGDGILLGLGLFELLQLLLQLDDLDQLFHLIHAQLATFGLFAFLHEGRVLDHRGVEFGPFRLLTRDAEDAVVDEIHQSKLAEQELEGPAEGNVFQVHRDRRREGLIGLLKALGIDVDGDSRVIRAPGVACLMYLSTSSSGVSLGNDMATGSSSFARTASDLASLPGLLPGAGREFGGFRLGHFLPGLLRLGEPELGLGEDGGGLGAVGRAELEPRLEGPDPVDVLLDGPWLSPRVSWRRRAGRPGADARPGKPGGENLARRGPPPRWPGKIRERSRRARGTGPSRSWASTWDGRRGGRPSWLSLAQVSGQIGPERERRDFLRPRPRGLARVLSGHDPGAGRARRRRR